MSNVGAGKWGAKEIDLLEGQSGMNGRRAIDRRGRRVAINQDLQGQKFSLNYFRPLLRWQPGRLASLFNGRIGKSTEGIDFSEIESLPARLTSYDHVKGIPSNCCPPGQLSGRLGTNLSAFVVVN